MGYKFNSAGLEGLEYVTQDECCLHRFLCNQAKDVDLRKWAAEGLAYLTLDADVKESVADDTEALISLIDLAKVRITTDL